jgi:hypothetical protein
VAPQDANGTITNVATVAGNPGFNGIGAGAGSGIHGQGGATGSGADFYPGGVGGSGAIAHGILTSYSPTWRSQDAGDNNKWSVDHNGYPMGSQLYDYHERWREKFTINAAGLAVNAERWRWITSQGTTPSATCGTQTLGSFGTWPGVDLVVTGTNNDNAYLTTDQMLFFPNTWTVGTAQWSMVTDSSSLANFTWYQGFIDDSIAGSFQSHTTTAANYIAFRKANADTNWQCVCRSGGVETVVDSGLAASASTAYHFKIEVYSSGSYLSGANTVKFFINGVLRATTTTNVPSANFRWAWGAICTTGTSSRHAYMGLFDFCVNPYSVASLAI